MECARSQLPDPLEWEGRLGERPDRQPQEHQRIVVTGDSVQVEPVASGATVDQDPFAVAANGDGDRFHECPAVSGPISQPDVVQVAAPEAVRAVVPVGCSRGDVGDVGPAVPASERAVLG
jgi:hypothetical protein